MNLFALTFGLVMSDCVPATGFLKHEIVNETKKLTCNRIEVFPPSGGPTSSKLLPLDAKRFLSR